MEKIREHVRSNFTGGRQAGIFGTAADMVANHPFSASIQLLFISNLSAWIKNLINVPSISHEPHPLHSCYAWEWSIVKSFLTNAQAKSA
jgi:hypothetical protein